MDILQRKFQAKNFTFSSISRKLRNLTENLQLSSTRGKKNRRKHKHDSSESDDDNDDDNDDSSSSSINEKSNASSNNDDLIVEVIENERYQPDSGL